LSFNLLAMDDYGLGEQGEKELFGNTFFAINKLANSKNKKELFCKNSFSSFSPLTS